MVTVRWDVMAAHGDEEQKGGGDETVVPRGDIQHLPQDQAMLAPNDRVQEVNQIINRVGTVVSLAGDMVTVRWDVMAAHGDEEQKGGGDETVVPRGDIQHL